MTKDRTINGVGRVKHDKVDYITDLRSLTIWCKFYNEDQKVVAADNLNFTLKQDKYIELKEILGLDKFGDRTPIRLSLSINEKKLEEWENLIGISEEPQTDLKED